MGTAPRLRSLEWVEHDVCRGTFDDAGAAIEVVFELHRVRDIVLVNARPDVLRHIDGTAAHLRTVSSAVAAFCLAAQGESHE